MTIKQIPDDQSGPAGSSASQNTSVGSSSRPGQKSSYPIKSSAPADPREMGRAPSGWLK